VLNAVRRIEDIFSEVESVPDFAGQRIDSVNYHNGYGDTPLHIVSCWGDCEAIEQLVQAGADINAQGETGFTPLHCAAEQNKPGAIQLLIRLGASIITDSNNQTPAELAKQLGNNEAYAAF